MGCLPGQMGFYIDMFQNNYPKYVIDFNVKIYEHGLSLESFGRK
jgi:hypothetical protein